MNIVRQWDLSTLGALGGALGDATRFAIYKHVVAAPEPVSASDVAAVFGLHRTVARSHLEKLTHADLLVIGTRRNPRGGRPAKVYSPSATRFDIQLPPRRYETLAGALARLATHTDGSSATHAEKLGYELGREAAAGWRGTGQTGGLEPDDVGAFLRDTGCSPRVTVRDDHTVVIEIGNCVFLEVAREHPELVCALDGGMLCGLLGVEPAAHRQIASAVDGAPACVHEFSARD
jgi:predicted ArsR family transcriptional regulator